MGFLAVGSDGFWSLVGSETYFSGFFLLLCCGKGAWKSPVTWICFPGKILYDLGETLSDLSCIGSGFSVSWFCWVLEFG